MSEVSTNVGKTGVAITLEAPLPKGQVIEVSAGQLRKGGWGRSLVPGDDGYVDLVTYVDQGGAIAALEDWHNGEHAGALRVCYEQPCRAVREALDESVGGRSQ